jgi:trehalose transport system substrate-binding protein
MRRMMRPWLAVTAVFALLASACGGGGDEQQPGPQAQQFAGTTITFSTSLAETEQPAVEELIQQFEQQTGATVKIAAITSADLPQKLKVEVESGRHTVHLFAQDNLALAVLVEDGLVEDLSNVTLPEGVNPALIPEKFDGKQYFLPYRPNLRVAYVNTDRFQQAGVQPPRTTDELRAVAEKLKAAAGGQPKVTLSLEGPSGAAGVTISEWIVSYGGNPLLLNDQGSVQAFTFLQGLWRDGLIAKESLTAKFDTEIDNLRGETAWLAQNWTFTTGELAKQGLLEKFQVYEGFRGPARAAHVVGGEVLGIPKGVAGKEKAAAVALAQFLMSKPSQESLAAKNAWPSVRLDAYAQVPADQQTTFRAINTALKDGWYRPNVVYWSDVQDAINEGVRRIIVRGEPVEATLNELNGKIAKAAQDKGAEYPPPAAA